MPLLIVSQIQTNKTDRKVIKNRDKTAVLIISIKSFTVKFSLNGNASLICLYEN